MSKEFDKKIRDSINKLEITPATEVWENISSGMAAQSNQKGAVLVPWLKPLLRYGIAAAVAFLLGGTSVYVALNNNIKPNSIAKDKIETESLAIVEETGIVANIVSQQEALIEPKEQIIEATQNSDKQENKKNSTTVVAKNNTNNYLVYDDQERAVHLDLEAKYGKIAIQETPFKNHALSISTTAKEPIASAIELVDDEVNSYSRGMNKIVPEGYNGFWIGSKAGINVLGISKKVIPGAQVGLEMGYDFGNRFGISTGAHLSFNSLKYIPSDPSIDPINYDPVIVNYNTINVPLAFRYKITKLRGAKDVPSSLIFVNGLDYTYNYTQGFHALGLGSAIEYDRYLKGKTSIAFGLKGSVLRNYGYEAPISLNNSRFQYNLGLYTALRFVASKN